MNETSVKLVKEAIKVYETFDWCNWAFARDARGIPCPLDDETEPKRPRAFCVVGALYVARIRLDMSPTDYSVAFGEIERKVTAEPHYTLPTYNDAVLKSKEDAVEFLRGTLE
jgi:hypothetical protein